MDLSTVALEKAGSEDRARSIYSNENSVIDVFARGDTALEAGSKGRFCRLSATARDGELQVIVFLKINLSWSGDRPAGRTRGTARSQQKHFASRDVSQPDARAETDRGNPQNPRADGDAQMRVTPTIMRPAHGGGVPATRLFDLNHPPGLAAYGSPASAQAQTSP
jgi:hypothetical protein